jgi:hypothetical protein
MKSVYFSVILDGVFCAFLYLLLSQILFSYFFDNPVSLSLSITLTLILTLFTIKSFFSNRKKKELISIDNKTKNQIVYSLHFMPKHKLIALFVKAYANLNIVAEKRKDFLYLTDKKTLVILKFGYLEVSKADVVKAFNLIKKDQSVQIYSDEFSKEVKEFASRFVNVHLKDANHTVKLLKDANCLEDIKPISTLTKPKFSTFIKNLFNKKRAKTFFGFGIFFLLSSLIAPLKTYYIVWGCLMLIFALVCIFFGSREDKN